MMLDLSGDVDAQIALICAELIKKVGQERGEEERASHEREQGGIVEGDQ
jgi:hypothetical protein